eukprot:351627-Chlamydomonas_euryale.AAC.5
MPCGSEASRAAVNNYEQVPVKNKGRGWLEGVQQPPEGRSRHAANPCRCELRNKAATGAAARSLGKSISCMCMADRPSERAAQHGEDPAFAQDQTPRRKWCGLQGVEWCGLQGVEWGGACLSPAAWVHMMHGAPTKRQTTLMHG